MPPGKYVWFPLGHLGILGFRLLPFGNPVRVPITQKPQEYVGRGLDAAFGVIHLSLPDLW
jgi:hypothetical protein